MRIKGLRLFGIIAPLCCAWLCLPAHAVVLQQKWQAGQRLNYDVAMDGSVNMKAPADAAVFFAGVPLEAKVQVKSKTRLDTVSVDDAGVATLSPHVDQLNVTGTVLGQKGEFTLANGKAALSINGEPTDFAGAIDGKKLTDPPVTINISKSGHLESLSTIPSSAPVVATPNAPAEPEQLATKVTKFINLWLTRTLPALWPDRDVQQGDTWTAQVVVPATATAPAIPIGDFKFQYKGDELVGGHKLQHVSVTGQVIIDADSAAAISAKAAKPGAPSALKGMHLTAAKQRVDGDLWFDADAGQLAKAVLNLHSHADGTLPKAPDATAEPTKPSAFDFDGVLQVQLRDGG